MYIFSEYSKKINDITGKMKLFCRFEVIMNCR